jgi:glycosyltransferase involved in cell wall biosynthesis
MVTTAYAKGAFVHLSNHEQRADFNIRPDWYADRPTGISAFIRVQNEETFIAACLLAVKDFFDEILIALNNCTDATSEIIAELALPNVRVVEYPFTLHRTGPGHDDVPENSLRAHCYYYNWLLAQTRFSHACKWDGDNVALPCVDAHLKEVVLRSNVVYECGLNIAGDVMAHVSRDWPQTAHEPHYFRVARHTFYRQSPIVEVFTHKYRRGVRRVEAPTFLHMKFCRGFESYSRMWPPDWREQEKYRRVSEYRQPGPAYVGPYPMPLAERAIERALRHAGDVAPLESEQEGTLRALGIVLFVQRNQGLRGDIVEARGAGGQRAAFLACLADNLLPERDVDYLPMCKLKIKRVPAWRFGIRTGLRRVGRRILKLLNSGEGPPHRENQHTMTSETIAHRILMHLPRRLQRTAFRLRHPKVFQAMQQLRTLDVRDTRSIAPYDELRCIFVGIPKSAATSVARDLFGLPIGNHTRMEQYQMVFSSKQFNSYFKFAFVRNPWDRLVSAFFYSKAGGMGMGDQEWEHRNPGVLDDFGRFVSEWLTPETAETKVHFVPQYKFVCSERGTMLLDFVGHFENLAEDYAHVCRELNVDRPLRHHNKTDVRTRDYRDCYNDETRRIVADIYRRDIELFGYEFD